MPTWRQAQSADTLWRRTPRPSQNRTRSLPPAGLAPDWQRDSAHGMSPGVPTAVSLIPAVRPPVRLPAGWLDWCSPTGPGQPCWSPAVPSQPPGGEHAEVRQPALPEPTDGFVWVRCGAPVAAYVRLSSRMGQKLPVTARPEPSRPQGRNYETNPFRDLVRPTVVKASQTW